MNLHNIFDVSIIALSRNKTRALLTSLGIIIGVASVILLISIGEGLKAYINGQFESMGTNVLMVMPGKMTGQGGPGMTVNKLTFKLSDQLSKKAKYVKFVSPMIMSQTKIKYRDVNYDTSVLGLDPNYVDAMNYPAQIGRSFSSAEADRSAKVVVLGPTVVKKVFKLEDPIGKYITMLDKRFLVIGIAKAQGSALGQDDDDRVMVPITTLRGLLDTDRLNAISIKTDPEVDIDLAKQSVIDIMLKNKLDTDQFSVNSAEELLATINGILGALTLGLAGIAAISLIVGGIGIMNIMLVSVTERTREIGLRKAVGAQPKDILIQFLIEAVVLSLLGGLIGVAIGALGSYALSFFLQTSVTLWSIALAFGFSSAIGIIFGVWPARKASKLSPIDALRYE